MAPGKKDKKKTKKPKKERPPEEKVAFMRSKREQLKELKARQSAVYAAAIDALTELELDAAEHLGLREIPKF